MGRTAVNADDTAGARGVTLMVAPGIQYATHTAPDGDIHAELPYIRSVGIRDLAEVIDHRINHVYDSIGHYVRFSNGGWLRYMFDTRGNMVEFYMIGLDGLMSAEGDISVWQPQAQT
jgi:hypothetical protein